MNAANTIRAGPNESTAGKITHYTIEERNS
jgi:hypothetical protein